MKKGELIGILRDYEHNYGALYSFYENSVKNAEALLKKAERLSLGALLAVLQDGDERPGGLEADMGHRRLGRDREKSTA